jgi:hypothetical protein
MHVYRLQINWEIQQKKNSSPLGIPIRLAVAYRSHKNGNNTNHKLQIPYHDYMYSSHRYHYHYYASFCHYAACGHCWILRLVLTSSGYGLTPTSYVPESATLLLPIWLQETETSETQVVSSGITLMSNWHRTSRPAADSKHLDTPADGPKHIAK